MEIFSKIGYGNITFMLELGKYQRDYLHIVPTKYSSHVEGNPKLRYEHSEGNIIYFDKAREMSSSNVLSWNIILSDIKDIKYLL